jgi:equilibrative nucleoside transporter 1/2/3
MSGQGGIAVLVSGVQILLAIVSSSSSSTESEPDAPPADRQSTLAGVGLWALASVGSFVCMLSHRYLTRHQDYASVLSPIQHRQELEGDSTSSTKSSWTVSKRIFKKNLSLNIGVFMVFVVTLSVFPPITTSITSTHVPTPRLLQPTVFIPLHFFLFNGELSSQDPSLGPADKNPSSR